LFNLDTNAYAPRCEIEVKTKRNDWASLFYGFEMWWLHQISFWVSAIEWTDKAEIFRFSSIATLIGGFDCDSTLRKSNWVLGRNRKGKLFNMERDLELDKLLVKLLDGLKKPSEKKNLGNLMAFSSYIGVQGALWARQKYSSKETKAGFWYHIAIL